MNAPLYVKGDFAGVKIRILRWVITSVMGWRQKEVWHRRRRPCDSMVRCQAAGLRTEKGTMSQGVQGRQPWELEMLLGKEDVLPQSLQIECD